MIMHVGYSVAERSSGRVAPCAVCTMHMETRSKGFLVEPQNQCRRFVTGLASKPLGQFLQFGLKSSGDGFLVEAQNQGSGGFHCLGLKTDSYGLVIWASKSPRRFLGLGLKTKQASVCLLCHKTNGGRSARYTRLDLSACFMWKQFWLGFPSLASRLVEARRRVVHVVPLRRLYRTQVEDGWVNVTGYVGPWYPCFAIFFLLAPRGIVIF
jgi:hypothetical protein